jgi:diacylglycerol O-acyltransferase
MEQLPGADSIFLSMETGDSHSHVGGLTILDPSGCPDFDYKRFASFVAERIRLAPRFGWKIREVPLGLDRPYWIEDPDYDPHRHIRRIAVPSPGGIHELAELAGFLFGQPLEKGRPLWEIWYIEGVEGGRVALFMKAHHCLMDGVSGAGLGELLCDLEPNPETPLAAAHRPELKKPGEPGELDMLLRGVRNWLGTPGRILDYGRRSAGRAVATLRALGEPEAPPLPFSAPKTIFNRNVGPKRAFACVTLPLDEIKAVRKHFDVTVNDVLLAVTGSAVRQYLIDRDELPEESLQVLVPVSTRSEDDDRLGNRVTNIAVSWASDVDDPAERLRRISRNAKKAKELLGAGDTFFLNALGELLPSGRRRHDAAHRQRRRLERAGHAHPALHGRRAHRVDVPAVGARRGPGPQHHGRELHGPRGLRLHGRSGARGGSVAARGVRAERPAGAPGADRAEGEPKRGYARRRRGRG